VTCVKKKGWSCAPASSAAMQGGATYAAVEVEMCVAEDEGVFGSSLQFAEVIDFSLYVAPI